MTAGPNRDDWLWTINPEHHLTHSVGDAVFLYNKLSGTTHILNLVSMAMVDFLVDHPRTFDDIQRDFHRFLEVPAEDCPAGVVRRLFGELDDAGIMERVFP